MRLYAFLLVMLAIDFYAYQALRLVIMDLSALPRLLISGLYFLLSAFVIGYYLMNGREWFLNQPKNFQIYMMAFVFIIVISKFVLGCFVFLDDIRRLLLWLAGFFNQSGGRDISRSTFISQLGLLMGAIPLVSLTYGMLRNQYRYRVRHQRVPISDLPHALEGLRIVQISDIHSGSFTYKDPINNGIKLINDLKPDIVVFTGDLVNSVADEMDPYLDIFAQIQSKYGVFSVLGNHDYGDYHVWPDREAKARNLQKLVSTHAHMGWRLLRNESVTLQIEGVPLAIVGVENISALPRFRTYGDLVQAKNGVASDTTKILLSHDPSHWDHEVLQSHPDIALMLSGHTHGFQFGIEIPGWIKWSPSKYVYKQWAGLYTNGTQHLYVNRGFGTLGYPGRVGILPEITCLELKSS